VNNAGIGAVGDVSQNNDAEWARVLDVNVTGIARLLDAADDPQAAAEALRRRQPLGRLISADEVAYGIASLASPLAGSTTGTILRIDGGMTSLRV
jgi:NAD(P)-dependent dehydrogenase (short-subunit alcohol dehydrogenase family)